MTLRKLIQTALLAASVAIVPAISEADSILISGDASACFGVGCTPGDTDSYLGLIDYESNPVLDFLGFTDPVTGSLGINLGTGNFGRLEVNTAFPYAFVNTPFSLLLEFYSPNVADAAFSATIFGVVSLNAVGGIVAAFDPGVVSLPYSFNGQTGVLNVMAFSTAAPSGGSSQLNGFMVTQSVPEPASLSLLALGAAMFGTAARFRRKK